MNDFLKRFGTRMKNIGAVFQSFHNPLTVILLRLGLIRMPYFLYEISAHERTYKVLARPANTSMSDVFVLNEVLVQEAYSEILPHLKEGPIRFVDVGGNLGAFVIWLSKYRKISEGFVFEPLEANLHLLSFNIWSNEVANVHVVANALGGSTRTQSMTLKADSPGGSSLYESHTAPDGNLRSESISVLSFSDWIDEHPGSFDLLKMDCEGAEWEILDSAGSVAFQGFKAIVAEVHSGHENRDVAAFKQFFEDAGFSTVRWDGHSHGLYIGVRK